MHMPKFITLDVFLLSTWCKPDNFGRITRIYTHFAACVFRYQREMAVMFCEKSVFVCMDDKHRVKVGEPHYPVAAAERGKKVLVSRNSSFEVLDHDFTKFSLIITSGEYPI